MKEGSERGIERRIGVRKDIKRLWNVGAARCLTCAKSLCVRRLRLGALKFLFHPDRIDQIAAATAVASTDRSKSRWKNKTNEQTRKRKRSRQTPKPQLTNL